MKIQIITTKKVKETFEVMKQFIKKALKVFAIPFVAHRVSVIKATYENDVMTIEYDNGKTEQYNGSCTVWHKMPTMQRCSILKRSLVV